MEKMFPALYPILDSSLSRTTGVAREVWLRSLVAELLDAGVTILQYRNKTSQESEVLADALILRSAAPAGRCMLILNDYPALAVKAEFDGVHVGQTDMTPEAAREILGPGKVVGVSTHTPQQLIAADLTSADYVAIGPVFSTTSKQNPDPVVGLDGVRRARALTKKPLVAIGGITLENCGAVREAGADSIAVISSLFANPSGELARKIASDFFVRLR